MEAGYINSNFELTLLERSKFILQLLILQCGHSYFQSSN